jgi:hypothetical protein
MVQFNGRAPQNGVVLIWRTIIVRMICVYGACGTMVWLIFDDGMLSADFNTRRCTLVPLAARQRIR